MSTAEDTLQHYLEGLSIRFIQGLNEGAVDRIYRDHVSPSVILLQDADPYHHSRRIKVEASKHLEKVQKMYSQQRDRHTFAWNVSGSVEEIDGVATFFVAATMLGHLAGFAQERVSKIIWKRDYSGIWKVTEHHLLLGGGHSMY